MRQSSFQRIDLRRRTRKLASRERVGRYSRGRAWDLMESFVKHNWKILLILLFLPAGLSLPSSLLLHGLERWLFFGVVGISGPWLVLIAVILLSGAATPLMGLDGEGSTSDVLRRFRHDGWMLVNGMKIQSYADIDHVVIGPGGLLVVESKWSHYRWPISVKKQSFMSDQITKSVTQVLKNRKDIESQFAAVLEGVPIRAICVLWSGEESSDDLPWFEMGDVAVIRGPALGSWMKDFTSDSLDQPKIEQVWMELEEYALQRDKEDFARSGQPRQTVDRFIVRSILAPVVAMIAGLMLAVYGLIIIANTFHGWLIYGTLLFIAIGVAGLRIPTLRRVALGWLASSIGIGLIILGFVVQAHFR